MEVFEKAFNWLAALSSKLPVFEFKMFFIFVLAVILVVGVVIALTLLGSRAFKLKKACKKINKYLDGVDAITDENVGDFTQECFGVKTPQTLRDSWAQYVGVRFGYPSEIVSEQNVYDKEVKKIGNGRANLFIGIALVLVALFAFWGFGTLESVEMGVIHCAGLLLSGIIYLVIFILSRVQAKKSLASFDAMLEDLDAKVNLQVDSNYALDSSPLAELQALADEIVARNTSKEINIEEEEEEIPQTPIEELIEEKEYLESEIVEDEEPQEEIEEPSSEVVEDVIEEEPQEELIEEAVVEDAPIEEEPVVEEEVEEEPQVEETEEDVEEEVEEIVEEVVDEPQEEVVEEELQEEPQEESDEEEPIVEEESIEEEVIEDEPVEEEVVEEEAEESQEEVVEDTEEEPEEIEVVEGEDDEHDAVKPSKLANLSNLVDFMLARPLPKTMKMQVAGLMIGAFYKAKTKEDKKAIVDGLTKVMIDLQK